jgi:CelD/BcsL family acetyltransferase involved in cellulose biosynthesis
MLQAKVLRVGGEPVAFSFELRAGSTSHVIANSYDRRFARFSPGKLLTTRHFADLATEGVETIDWGAGDSGYKQAMGARRGAVFIDLVVVRPGMLSWLVSRLSPSAASRASWTCDA